MDKLEKESGAIAICDSLVKILSCGDFNDVIIKEISRDIISKYNAFNPDTAVLLCVMLWRVGERGDVLAKQLVQDFIDLTNTRNILMDISMFKIMGCLSEERFDSAIDRFVKSI